VQNGLWCPWGKLFPYSKEVTDVVGGLSPAVKVFAKELKILVLNRITRVEGFMMVH